MNLDELVKSIENSEVGLRKQLEIIVYNWKTDDSSIEDLIYLIGKWHGNVWFSSDENSNLSYENFREFKNIAISSIKGMTFNERLYSFGLFEIWNKSNDRFKKTIRLKLNAE